MAAARGGRDASDRDGTPRRHQPMKLPDQDRSQTSPATPPSTVFPGLTEGISFRFPKRLPKKIGCRIRRPGHRQGKSQEYGPWSSKAIRGRPPGRFREMPEEDGEGKDTPPSRGPHHGQGSSKQGSLLRRTGA